MAKCTRPISKCSIAIDLPRFASKIKSYDVKTKKQIWPHDPALKDTMEKGDTPLLKLGYLDPLKDPISKVVLAILYTFGK